MNHKTQSTSSIDLNLGTVLFLIFLVLKLTNHIDWSWWWVTAPLWIPVVVAIAILILAFCIKNIIK